MSIDLLRLSPVIPLGCLDELFLRSTVSDVRYYYMVKSSQNTQALNLVTCILACVRLYQKAPLLCSIRPINAIPLLILAVGQWFPPGTPVSSNSETDIFIIIRLFHRLHMTLAVAEAVKPQ